MLSLVRRCAVPVSLAIAAGVLGAAPALAAPTWVPGGEVEGSGTSLPAHPVVAVDVEGAATMVWLDQSLEPGGGVTVRASSHPVGGTWSPPQDLSAAGAVEEDRGHSVQLAVDPAGDAVAVWTQDTGAVDVVEYATRTPAGVWSAAGILSDTGVAAAEPTIGVDSAGNAVALWRSSGPQQDFIDGATKPLGAPWAPLAPLSDPENGAGEPSVAVAPDGRATAVWTHFDSVAMVERIETSSRTSVAAAFGPRTYISSDTAQAQEASVALNAAGNATAAWDQEAPDVDHRAVFAATMTPTGDWAVSERVSVAPVLDDDLDENYRATPVVDAAGTSTVAWLRHTAVPSLPYAIHTRTVESVTAPVGDAWSTPQTLGPTGSAGMLDLALDGAGNAIAAWPKEGTPKVGVVTRPAGGAWSGLIPIESGSDRAVGATVAAAPTGDLVVGWASASNLLGGGGSLSARAFDVSAPLMRSFSVPTSTTAGVAATFVLAAVDAWSPDVTSAWTFGDGGTAAGASASHTYAAPGSYTVTATATDASGNATTRTAGIVVAAAPVVVTPPPAATPQPALTGVKLTKKTIHVVGSVDKPRATKLKLTLNTDAQVTVKVKRTKKVDGKTVKAKVVKSLTQGAGAVKLTSKVGGKKLPPGTYQVTVTAKNVAGTSKPVVVKLKILK
ncbi:MAG: PKD domain-containing protein [Nocardioides sp.]